MMKYTTVASALLLGCLLASSSDGGSGARRGKPRCGCSPGAEAVASVGGRGRTAMALDHFRFDRTHFARERSKTLGHGAQTGRWSCATPASWPRAAFVDCSSSRSEVLSRHARIRLAPKRCRERHCRRSLPIAATSTRRGMTQSHSRGSLLPRRRFHWHAFPWLHHGGHPTAGSILSRHRLGSCSYTQFRRGPRQR